MTSWVVRLPTLCASVATPQRLERVLNGWNESTAGDAQRTWTGCRRMFMIVLSLAAVADPAA